MTQDEWTTRFTARLVAVGNLTEAEAALTASDFDGTEVEYGEPEACANNLITAWDEFDEGEPA